MPIKSRPVTIPGGTYVLTNDNGTTDVSGTYQKADVLDDGQPVGDCGPFTVNLYRAPNPVKMNGTRIDLPNYKTVLTEFIPQGTRDVAWTNPSNYGRPTNGALAAMLAARTSPSRTVVDLPAFVGELRDLPLLFKAQGDSIIKKAAGANLAIQFGWLPLVSDLQDFLNINGVVNKRTRELQKFYKSGLRRTIDLWSGSAQNTIASKTLSGLFKADLRGTEAVSIQHRTWGHIRWHPTTLPPQSDEAMRMLAARAAFGLSVPSLAASAWELMPWSWLVDYCSSVGDFLKAHRNTVPARYSKCCIMDEVTMTVQYSNFTGYHPSFSVTPETKGGFVKIKKSRVSATPSISAWLPMLSARQLSILGSIMISRQKFAGR